MNTHIAMNITTFAPVACRFVWKEYRMLRAFWAAVAALTVIEQRVSMLLAAPGSDLPSWLFGSALAAAVLYAAGAAATSFAVEHEEETYAFLAGVPATWLPALVGKMVVSLASALALAAVLAVTGWGLADGRWPAPTHVDELVGMLGVAILEAVAWGTFFSLLLRRPLVAAMLTLVVGIAAVNVAVNCASSQVTPALNLSAYSEALPLRLAIIAVVFTSTMLLARRWLATGARHASAAATPSAPTISAFRAALSRAAAPAACVFASLRRRIAARAPRRPMLARLLWQTWRESWKLLFLPPFVAFAFMAFIGLSIGFAAPAVQPHVPESALPLLGLGFFLPAMYGAMAFHADQRRASYRFLAEHAARPRSVWLARHVVWLGGLTLCLAVIAVVAVVMAMLALQDEAEYSLPDWWHRFPPQELWARFQTITWQATSGSQLALLGTLAAYALGQLCSMLLRSGILAAFLAIVLAVVLGAWTALLFVWQLNGWLFLLPLTVGLLAATWLRAPGWIASRHTWRTWTGPALAVVAPFVLIGLTLPAARLAQLPVDKRMAESTVHVPIKAFDPKDFSPEDLETAQMYFRAFDLLMSLRENGLDEAHRPADETAFYAQAQARFRLFQEKHRAEANGVLLEANRRWRERIEADARETADMYLQINQRLGTPGSGSWFHELPAAQDEIISVSRRPRCQLPVQEAGEFSPEYDRLTELARSVAYTYDTPKTRIEPTLDRLLAALRMCGHLREGQPVCAFMVQLETEQAILKSITYWAQDDSRTSEELADALKRLQAHFDSRQFKTSSGPGQALWADRQVIRDVIEGKQQPLILAGKSVSPAAYLAYLANQLPWERRRALRALDLITLQNGDDLGTLWRALSQPRRQRESRLERWLWPDWPPEWVHEQRAAATSWLVRFEYEARVPVGELHQQSCNTEMYRRATLLRIALIAYRRDHDQYPPLLGDLVPDYLAKLPLDPYSSELFQYAPAGLDLPLLGEDVSLGNGQWRRSRIEPRTPLFWSVGPENVRLTQQADLYLRTDENAPHAEPIEAQGAIYVPTVDGSDWYYRANWGYLIFPLPK